MKRRKFVAAAGVSALAMPLNSIGRSIADNATNEIYELRTYKLAWGGNQKALISFLKEVEGPFLKELGATHCMNFSEHSQELPGQLWTLIAYPGFDSYQKAIAERNSDNYLNLSKEYTDTGQIYNRISSSLLYAFDGLKQMQEPIPDASLFELRIYEGLNEDAVRRKTIMFNEEELELFYKVDMNPIFFGSMLAGPYVPSLVYMLNFRDMAHRDQAWDAFVKHPEWDIMKNRPVYANTVSNIRRVFLERA